MSTGNALLTHGSKKINLKTIGTVHRYQNGKHRLGAEKRTPLAMTYTNKRVQPTQGLRWEILYVLAQRQT
jgi:hypothetical protein